MDDKIVIDKDYVFGACGSGCIDEGKIHVRCNHDETMMYGKYFSENIIENEEIDVRFNIRDQLDEYFAKSLAESLYEQRELDDDEEEDSLTVDDFYDAAYDLLSETYYYYCWSPEFKEDCINYYMSHKLCDNTSN